MKDILKTIIVVASLLLFIVIGFFISTNIKYGVELFTRVKLDKNDPTVTILMDKLDSIKSIRKAYLSGEDLSSLEVIKFTFDNYNDSDYKEVTFIPEKIVCHVNNTIEFTTDKDMCLVRVFSNELFMNYQKSYFGVENEIEFQDIKYHGLDCRNNGTNYYCLVGNYSDSVVDYSIFSEGYEEKDKVVIREYYLRIDLNDKERCLNYFSSDVCTEKNNVPKINDDIVVKDGVLYEHVFKKVDDQYILEKSFIIAEG